MLNTKKKPHLLRKQCEIEQFRCSANTQSTEPRKGHRAVYFLGLSFLTYYELISHYHKILGHSHKLANHYHKILCYSHNLVSRGNEILRCSSEILSHGNEMLTCGKR